jgi:hypothetical protein
MGLGTFDYTPKRACIHLQLLVYSPIRPRFSRSFGHCRRMAFVNQLSLICAHICGCLYYDKAA